MDWQYRYRSTHRKSHGALGYIAQAISRSKEKSKLPADMQFNAFTPSLWNTVRGIMSYCKGSSVARNK